MTLPHLAVRQGGRPNATLRRLLKQRCRVQSASVATNTSTPTLERLWSGAGAHAAENSKRSTVAFACSCHDSRGISNQSFRGLFER